MSTFYDYRLTMTPRPDDTQSIWDFITSNFGWSKTEPEELDGEFCEMTWYDHELDMAKLSRRFPDIVFKLEVLHENPASDERYCKYFKGGKIQVATQPPFPEFDPKKLRTPKARLRSW